MAAVLVRGFGMGRVGILGGWGCWLVGGKEGERGGVLPGPTNS